MIGGPNEAACFERSAGRMSRFVPFEGAEFTYHTNHPLINDDFNPRFSAIAEAARNDPGPIQNSVRGSTSSSGR